MVGSREIKGRVGLIVRQESPAADRREKREEVIQHVDQQWLSALLQ